MQRIHRTVHTLRQKPEHVRERIAIGSSAAITAVIAVVWATSLSNSGALALNQGSQLNPATAETTAPASQYATADLQGSVSQLMGAVGALPGTGDADNNDPVLTIIDGAERSTMSEATTPPPSATVIPF